MSSSNKDATAHYLPELRTRYVRYGKNNVRVYMVKMQSHFVELATFLQRKVRTLFCPKRACVILPYINPTFTSFYDENKLCVA